MTVRIHKSAQIERTIAEIVDQIPIIDFTGIYVFNYRSRVQGLMADMILKLRRRTKIMYGANHDDQAFEVDGKPYHRSAREDKIHHDGSGYLKGLSLVIEIWAKANYTLKEITERQVVSFEFERIGASVVIKWTIKHIFHSGDPIAETLLTGFHGKPISSFADTVFTNNAEIGAMLIEEHHQSGEIIPQARRLTLTLRNPS